MAQRFKVGDEARVFIDHDGDGDSWIGEIVTIKEVMPDGLPYDYFTERKVPHPVWSDDFQSWYDDYQLDEVLLKPTDNVVK